nr:hypothetical protein [Tanacetum cinerariifolium]GEW60974.1 hypothetical protein [Tanacetum cinerariifolium]GEW72445.1 hypothetical protein [Tanacetum cinerariifolium]
MPLFPSPEPSVSYIDDLDFFKVLENEFPAIVFNDALTSKSDFSTETTLCPQHIDKFDFKDETSLSEYDEVEQNVLYFNDILPFNIIYPDDLKSDKDNDDNEIDVIQSSRGNENTQGSHKLLKASHDKINNVFKMRSFIMKFNVNIVAQNYFVSGMLFNLIKNLYVPFGIPFDPKRYHKDGDYTRMLQRPRYVFFTLLNLGKIGLQERIRRIRLTPKRFMEPLPPRDQRHLWLRYQVEAYTKEIVYDFEQRLEMIFGRQRMRMVYIGDDGQEVFVSHTWRRLFEIQASLVNVFLLEFFNTCRIGDEIGLDADGTLCFQLGGSRRSMTRREFILALGLHTAEEMAEDGFRSYLLGSERVIPNKGGLSNYWVKIYSGREFLRGAPFYTYIRDPIQRLCHKLISYSISGRGQAPKKVTATDLFYLCIMDRRAANVSYLLAQYLFMHAEGGGEKSDARLFGGHFIGCLAHYFGLVSDDELRGLSIVNRKILLIDMGELVKLKICMEIEDGWAWVGVGPETQPDAAAGAPIAIEDAPAVDKGAQADLAPM